MQLAKFLSKKKPKVHKIEKTRRNFQLNLLPNITKEISFVCRHLKQENFSLRDKLICTANISKGWVIVAMS